MPSGTTAELLFPKSSFAVTLRSSQPCCGLSLSLTCYKLANKNVQLSFLWRLINHAKFSDLDNWVYCFISEGKLIISSLIYYKNWKFRCPVTNASLITVITHHIGSWLTLLKACRRRDVQPVEMNRDLWIYIDRPAKWIVFFRVDSIFQRKREGWSWLYVLEPKLQLVDKYFRILYICDQYREGF